MESVNPIASRQSRRYCLRRLAGLGLAGLGLFAGCGSSASSPPPTQPSPPPAPPPASPAGGTQGAQAPPIRIGLLAPLRGANAPFGAAARQAAQRGIYRVGGQRRYQLVVEDDSGSLADQGTAARKLVAQDQVVTALIAIGSPTPSVPAQIFQEASIPVVGWACMRDLFEFPGPTDFVFVNRETFEFVCPQQPSPEGAAVFAEDTMVWILRAIAAADPWAIAADPGAIRDALARTPYR